MQNGEGLDLATFAQLVANHGHFVWLRTGLAANQQPGKYVNHTIVVCSLRNGDGASPVHFAVIYFV